MLVLADAVKEYFLLELAVDKNLRLLLLKQGENEIEILQDRNLDRFLTL